MSGGLNEGRVVEVAGVRYGARLLYPLPSRVNAP